MHGTHHVSLSGDHARAGVSSFTLKVVAILAMTCNHVANVFASMLPPLLETALYGLGGATFPIMAYLLTEGFRHTSDMKRYALRLAGFAAVSQIPYSLLWGATPNVLWTLLLALGVLCANRTLTSTAARGGILIAAALVSTPFDWGLVGVPLVYAFDAVRGRKNPRAALACVLLLLAAYIVYGAIPFLAVGDFATEARRFAVSLTSLEPVTGTMAHRVTGTVIDAGYFAAGVGQICYAIVGIGIACGVLVCYNGMRGRSMKWFFYVYYPLHLLAIWGVQALLRGGF